MPLVIQVPLSGSQSGQIEVTVPRSSSIEPDSWPEARIRTAVSATPGRATGLALVTERSATNQLSLMCRSSLESLVWRLTATSYWPRVPNSIQRTARTTLVVFPCTVRSPALIQLPEPRARKRMLIVTSWSSSSPVFLP